MKTPFGLMNEDEGRAGGAHQREILSGIRLIKTDATTNEARISLVVLFALASFGHYTIVQHEVLTQSVAFRAESNIDGIDIATPDPPPLELDHYSVYGSLQFIWCNALMSGALRPTLDVFNEPERPRASVAS
ncbi:hypothetical protein B0H17DRAFT_1210793 [Mycena rosella]|uniref:Uncharacterized protein n=1 Tax=Mycena rosella TaxID=1033263 RepID=A0AAD7CVI8_MYCRO|nr:hypothetical protein B0H17DRAFT_1210793 [Mycena rosella]